MISKLRLIFLFGSISLSVQRQVRDDNSKVNRDIEDLVKLIGNLNAQPHSHSDNEDHHQDAHDHHSKDHSNLMNIQTLNMFYKNKDKNRADSDTDVQVHKVPKHVHNSHEAKDEIEDLLNELEKELNKDEKDGTKLRCNSKRCGKNSKRCGCGRAGVDKTLRCRTCSVDRAERQRPVQRCRGKRCGRTNDRGTSEDINAVDDESNERRNRNDRSEYRCRGNRCGRSRNVDGNNGLNSLTAKSSKKYKINDDLDAIVLDLSDLDGLLNKYGDCKDGKCRGKRAVNKKQNLAVVENVDLNNLINNVNSHDNVEAIFIDLSQVENSEDIAKYIKSKFSSNAKKQEKIVNSEDLFNYYSSVKKEVIDLVVRYMQGDVTLQKLSFLPNSVKQKVYNLKQKLQGVAVNENQIRKEINRIAFERGDTKVVPHGENNNNIYVPKWLHTAIVYALNNYNLRMQKSLFPLTLKQREKLKNKTDLWRRTSKADVEARGIPFELSVQGLGQVAPKI